MSPSTVNVHEVCQLSHSVCTSLLPGYLPFHLHRAKTCCATKVHGDKRELLSPGHVPKEMSDLGEGGEMTKENPLAETTTDPSY